MSRTIQQFRFYNNEADKNYAHNNSPFGIGINTASLQSGDVFFNKQIKDEYGFITSIGIQAPPGTKIYFNQNIDPIIIGHTGIFELDLTNKSFIYKITLDKESVNIINDNPNACLIIDAIYDTEV